LSNPYLESWRNRRVNRRIKERTMPVFVKLLPVLAVGAAAPFVSPVFLAVSEQGYSPSTVSGLSMRLGWLVCAAMSLHTYTALLRDKERKVLDPHPAQPGKLVHYLLLRTAYENVALLLSGVVFMWPIATQSFETWLICSTVVFGGWITGLCLGFPVHLGSVWAAESPRLSKLLELLRGSNPRMHAALIYAPGVVLALGGVSVWAASSAAQTILGGAGIHPIGLIVPFLVSVMSLPSLATLAQKAHFRATLVLAEIDGWYAQIEQPDEERLVYLEWLAVRLPSGVRQVSLRELRHGWRSLRSWINGGWLIGFVCAAAGWSASPDAWVMAGTLAGAGLVIVGGVSIRLAVNNPQWLERSLPINLRRQSIIRCVVVWLWLQGVVLLPVLAVWIRQDLGTALNLGIWVEVVAAGVAVVGVFASRMLSRGWGLYVPVSLAIWAISVRGMMP
jgi:hypothetical protein